MEPRTTRARTALLRESAQALAGRVLATSDIQTLLVPRLDFRTFVALRFVSKDIRDATQLVCEDLIRVLERASALYVSPRFAEGLALIAQHQTPICWLIQTPVLAVVAAERHDELIGDAYHLLQAHLSRLQKLSVSLSLRRASARSRPHVPEASRFMLMHLGVRLGMFTESVHALRELLAAAQTAVDGLAALHQSAAMQPPATAAAHYTIAGFCTYHHKQPELSGALGKAQAHLDAALRIQRRQLGPRHVSTLCSQLVKAQVMLLQNNTHGCGQLLRQQLRHCAESLSEAHPLAAKMFAVQARLQQREGRLAECERLQQQVLAMRRDALGLHHEDTHRSAMDVYQHRRKQVLKQGEDPQAYLNMASSMEVCIGMLRHASLDACGLHGFALSKSLQGMSEFVFADMRVLARRGVWSRDQTVELLGIAADTAAILPPAPLPTHTAALSAAAAAAAAGEAVPSPPPAPQPRASAASAGSGQEVLAAADDADTDADADAAAAAAAASPPEDGSDMDADVFLRVLTRRDLVRRLREMRDVLRAVPTWPPPRAA